MPSLLDVIVSEAPELEAPPATMGEALPLVLTMACYFAGMVVCILAVTALARKLRRQHRREEPAAATEGGNAGK